MIVEDIIGEYEDERKKNIGDILVTRISHVQTKLNISKQQTILKRWNDSFIRFHFLF